MNNVHCAGAVFLTAAVLVGCGEDRSDAEVERVRAIKPYFVVEPSGGDVRRFSGTIVAANSSALSFAVAGTVQAVEVNQGERVVEGQLLAALDTEPFELDVQAAQSQVATAQAGFDNSRVELDRQRQLYERGWVARAAYDQAIAAFDAADGELNLARSRLGLAERELANAGLLAPFDGVISRRDVEPFVEIQKGQTILQIDSEGALEVNLSVTDSIVGRLSVGAPVTIDAVAVPGCGCTGRVTEIGVAAGAANAVPVTAAILATPGGLLPGMGVEASLVLSDDDGSRGLLVPLVALAPGDDQARGYVFKYDESDGVVRKVAVAVEGDGIVRGNLVSISVGLDAGDIVAAAGVSFLRDGQRVKLLGE